MFIILQKQLYASLTNQVYTSPAGMYCIYRSGPVYIIKTVRFFYTNFISTIVVIIIMKLVITDTLEEIPYHVQYIEPSDHDPIVVSQII